MNGIVYAVRGWRAGVDPLDERWGATCANGEVARGATRAQVQTWLATHVCGPDPVTLAALTPPYVERDARGRVIGWSGGRPGARWGEFALEVLRSRSEVELSYTWRLADGHVPSRETPRVGDRLLLEVLVTEVAPLERDSVEVVLRVEEVENP